MNIGELSNALRLNLNIHTEPTTSAEQMSGAPQKKPATQSDTLGAATSTKSTALNMASSSIAKPSSPADLARSSSATSSSPKLPKLSPTVTHQLHELRPLTRNELAEPQLIVAMGRYFAREHAKVARAMPESQAETPLFLLEDARGRLTNVKASKEKFLATPLDLGAVEATLDALELELSEAGKDCVYGDFNVYPGALSITPNGEIISNPDDRNTGWHTVYEILNRHVFTSRLSHDDMTMLADAYMHEAHSRRATLEELELFGESKYVFDILYHLYFIDVAFDAPSSGDEVNINKMRSLQQAELMLERIEADRRWLFERGIELEPLIARQSAG